MTSALDDAPIARAAGEAQWDPAVPGLLRRARSAPRRRTPPTTVLGLRAQLPVPPASGAASSAWATGDQVLFTFDSFGKPLLRLDGPARAATGQAVRGDRDGRRDRPAARRRDDRGRAGRERARTGGSQVPFDAPGVRTLKAERAGSVRSNTLEVCVEQPGIGACAASCRRCRSRRAACSDSRRPGRPHQRSARTGASTAAGRGC